MAYSEVRNYIAPPRQQWSTRHGTEFTYQGTPLSVTEFTKMFHNIYNEMEELLEDLTFGLAKDHVFDPIIDDPQELKPGYGFLTEDTSWNWAIMQHILDNPELNNRFFGKDGQKRTFNRKANMDWLDKAARFKELFYIVIHCLCGMPKCGSEEWRLRVFNSLFRQRNFMYMFGRTAIVGVHNKTSAATGVDKTTLHFVPKAFERFLRIYYAFVMTHETYVIEHMLNIDKHKFLCYFLSSKGAHWSTNKDTAVLKAATRDNMGVALGKAPLRHILSGIAQHYNIGIHTSSRGNSVLHSQLGHSDNTGERLYARMNEIHKQLTNQFCHDTLDFCDSWAELWGFDTKIPSVDRACARQTLFEKQGSWLTPKSDFSDAQLTAITEHLQKLSSLVQNLIPSSSVASSIHLDYLQPPIISSLRSSVSSRNDSQQQLPFQFTSNVGSTSSLVGRSHSQTHPLQEDIILPTISGPSSHHGSSKSQKRNAQEAFSNNTKDSDLVCGTYFVTL